jgi:HEAT repeat protein
MSNELLIQLQSRNEKIRYNAAAELGDSFESRGVSDEASGPLAEQLIAALLVEDSVLVRERIAYTLMLMGMSGYRPSVSWDAMASSLDRLEPQALEYALSALGFTKNMRYETTISRYLRHSHETVRDAAAEALQELKSMRENTSNHA